MKELKGVSRGPRAVPRWGGSASGWRQSGCQVWGLVPRAGMGAGWAGLPAPPCAACCCLAPRGKVVVPLSRDLCPSAAPGWTRGSLVGKNQCYAPNIGIFPGYHCTNSL